MSWCLGGNCKDFFERDNLATRQIQASNEAECHEKAEKAHTDIDFRKLCQKTGSGPAPSQPPLKDSEDDNLHDTEPMETPFNELAHPQDRMTSRAEGSVPSSSSCNIIWSSSPIFYTSVSDNKVLYLCIQPGFLDKNTGSFTENTGIFMLIWVLNSQKRYPYFLRSFKTLDDKFCNKPLNSRLKCSISVNFWARKMFFFSTIIRVLVWHLRA